MATKGRKSKESRGERVIEPCKRIFFVERKLYRVILSNKSQNIVYLFSINEGKEQAMLLSDFRKNRKRAYTIIDTARLLNRAEAQMHRYIDQGIAPPPIGAAIGGVRTFHKKSYYSEDEAIESIDNRENLINALNRMDDRTFRLLRVTYPEAMEAILQKTEGERQTPEQIHKRKLRENSNVNKYYSNK